MGSSSKVYPLVARRAPRMHAPWHSARRVNADATSRLAVSGDCMDGLRGATAKYVGTRQRWRGGVVFAGVEKMPEHAVTCCEALPKKKMSSCSPMA